MKGLMTITTLIFLSNLAIAQPTIGPHPDGVSFTVLSSKKISKPDELNCGRNDLGMPILGLYERQTKRYTRWKDNKPVLRRFLWS